MTRDKLGPVARCGEVMSGKEITNLLILQDGIRSLGNWGIKFRFSLFPVMQNWISEMRGVEYQRINTHFSFPTLLPSSSFDHASFCSDLLEDAVLPDNKYDLQPLSRWLFILVMGTIFVQIGHSIFELSGEAIIPNKRAAPDGLRNSLTCRWFRTREFLLFHVVV